MTDQAAATHRLYVADGTEVWITHTNHLGDTTERHIKMYSAFWGTTEYHTKPQFIIPAFDLDHGEWCEFAKDDISSMRGTGWP